MPFVNNYGACRCLMLLTLLVGEFVFIGFSNYCFAIDKGQVRDKIIVGLYYKKERE